MSVYYCKIYSLLFARPFEIGVFFYGFERFLSLSLADGAWCHLLWFQGFRISCTCGSGIYGTCGSCGPSTPGRLKLHVVPPWSCNASIRNSMSTDPVGPEHTVRGRPVSVPVQPHAFTRLERRSAPVPLPCTPEGTWGKGAVCLGPPSKRCV